MSRYNYLGHLCTTVGCTRRARRGQSHCDLHGAASVTESVSRLMAGIPDRSALTDRIEGTLRDHCEHMSLDVPNDRRAVATIVASAIAKSLRQRT